MTPRDRPDSTVDIEGSGRYNGWSQTRFNVVQYLPTSLGDVVKNGEQFTRLILDGPDHPAWQGESRYGLCLHAHVELVSSPLKDFRLKFCARTENLTGLDAHFVVDDPWLGWAPMPCEFVTGREHGGGDNGPVFIRIRQQLEPAYSPTLIRPLIRQTE